MEWREISRTAEDAAFGFSAVSVVSLIPMFFALFLLEIFEIVGASNNFFLQSLPIFFIILGMSHFIGVILGLVIRLVFSLRKAVKYYWKKYTPPYPEANNNELRETPPRDRGNFKETIRKSRFFYKMGAFVLVIEFVFIGTVAFILDSLGLQEISELSLVIEGVSNAGSGTGLLSPSIGAITVVLSILIDYNQFLILLAVPPSIVFIFATQNSVYIFRDRDFLYQLAHEGDSMIFYIFAVWSRVSLLFVIMVAVLLFSNSYMLSITVPIGLYGGYQLWLRWGSRLTGKAT